MIIRWIRRLFGRGEEMANAHQSRLPPPEEVELRESRTLLHLAHARAQTVTERGRQAQMHWFEQALTPPADPASRRRNPEPNR